MANKELAAKIINYMQDGVKTITIGSSKDRFTIEVNEDIDFNEVHNAIDNIVENVTEQDHSFEVIDLLMGYYILKLFTNIPVPVTEDENSEDGSRPDFNMCNEIVAKLGLTSRLCEASPIVAFYMDVLIKNVWRKLDYNKAILSVLPFNDLMDAIAEFYSILDELAEIPNQDENLAELKDTLNNFADKLSELQPDFAEKSGLKLVENDKE